MEAGRYSLQFGTILMLAAMAFSAVRLAAQAPAPAKPNTPVTPVTPVNPVNPVNLDRVIEEHERVEAFPRNLAWNPSGTTLSFLRTTIAKPATAARGFVAHAVPNSEIGTLDTATGLQSVLVSTPQIMSAFGATAPRPTFGDEEDTAALRKQIRTYAWAPSGHALLLASPGSLVWYDLDTHSAQTLVTSEADLSHPEISPDGHTVSFIRGHGLWLTSVGTSTPSAPSTPHTLVPHGKEDILRGEPDWPYFHELGMRSAYWWSPDSSRIAWLETDDSAVEKYALRTSEGEDRSIVYPKPGAAIPTVRLFVQSIAGGKPIRIDLGNDANVYIPRVQWLPDGKHLAVERLSRDQKTLDLLMADPLSGKTHTLLTEKDVYWINLNDGLHFLKDSKRFLWMSERSGNSHLYLYDTAGQQLAQLTHGAWEVTSLVGVDDREDAVYFTATEATPLERQLYRVHLDGTGMTRVTHDKGTHASLLSPGGNVLLDTWSSYATPPRQSLLLGDGSIIASIQNSSRAAPVADQLAPIEFFTIKMHLGSEVDVSMRKPADFDPAKKYPVILYVAGGPGEQAVRDAWGGDISLWFSLMAQKGYVIFALDGRGSGGHGHLFEEPIHLRFSASEMADQRDGVQYLRTLPWVDASRIGIAGWGYGGFLALHGMLDRPVIYKAGFAGAPVTDWMHYDAIFAERYLEDPVKNQDGWLASSPTENAMNLNAPLLLAQATMDETVHVENSMMLLDELLDKGKYADILLFPDRRDLFEDHATRKILFQRLTEFFLKNL